MTVSVHTHPVAGGKATATITFAGVPADGETIVIVDAAGTSKTYTAKNAGETLASGFFNRGGTAAAAATSLKACIEHASGGHNGTITVADDSSGGLTLTQTVGGTEGNKGNVHGSGTGITDGLANVTTVDFAGGGMAELADKGVIANGGNVSGSKFAAKSLIDTNKGSRASGAKVTARTGTSNVPGIAKGNSSGTLAYSGPTTRSKADTGFVIRGGVANKISGLSLNPILHGASDTTSRKSGNIAVKTAYRGKGLLSGQIFNLYRDPTSAQPYRGGTAGGDAGLRQDDNTAKAGISGWGTSRALASDHAAAVGFGAAPRGGEFYILSNFTDFDGTGVSGGSGGSENMMDYSALTGG
jgi:hypothetical protein